MAGFVENFYIRSVSAQAYTFEKQSAVFVEGRRFCSLSFRKSGKILINDLSVAYPSVLFVPANTDYTTEILESGEAYVVHFDAGGEQPCQPLVMEVKDPLGMELLFEELIEECNAKQTFKAFSSLYAILHNLEENHTKKPQISKRMLVAKRYITENFKNGFISVSQLSQKVGISETYFRKEFKKAFSCSPTEYMRNLRISYAVFLLEIGEESVTDIAIRCGYDSPSYFSYDFRKVMGKSPSQYAK